MERKGEFQSVIETGLSYKLSSCLSQVDNKIRTCDLHKTKYSSPFSYLALLYSCISFCVWFYIFNYCSRPLLIGQVLQLRIKLLLLYIQNSIK